MPVGNEILKWFFIILLAYGYGSIVLYVLKFDKDNHFIPLSIGLIGILIGKFIPFLNISKAFYIAGIPIISSLIASFIVPGILWFFRRDTSSSGSENG
ncbi:hypothetical protein KKB99_06130 [bacterium]|nr:hypothetical protein [bacterium]MBU1025565.1 hypothetical protein [bacterium]